MVGPRQKALWRAAFAASLAEQILTVNAFETMFHLNHQ
jgi:hypothetical protein